MPHSMLWNAAPPTEYTMVCVFAQKMKEAMMMAHDCILAAHVKQTRQANQHRCNAPFTENDLVYISTKNINLPKGKACKLAPKYIGLYKILKDLGNESYKINLPSDLCKCGVYDMFHTSLLRIHVPNDNCLFPGWDVSQVIDLLDKDESG